MITVVGLGFVGLSTALGFAEKGFKVFGLEANEQRRNMLLDSKVPFFEPMLEEKLGEHLGGNFQLTKSSIEAVSASEAIFLCVGTPTDDSGKSDLSIVKSAIKELAPAFRTGAKKTIIIKSTVPPGTLRDEIAPFVSALGYQPDENVFLASNPEFLREGYAWQDFSEPDRIVAGTNSEEARQLLERLYSVFSAPLHLVSSTEAEFIKYLSNSMLSTMISYANEMSMIAGAIGDIETKRAFDILHEDKRWFGNPAPMNGYVHPGCGFGGYCLPKDTQALVAQAEQFGADPVILKAVLKTNDAIRRFVVERVSAVVDKKARIGIAGLAFKPGSDDVRDTPAQHIVKGLVEAGYSKLVAFDPEANDEFKHHYPEIPLTYASSVEKLREQSDSIVVLTAWKDFQAFSGEPNVLDFRYYLS